MHFVLDHSPIGDIVAVMNRQKFVFFLTFAVSVVMLAVVVYAVFSNSIHYSPLPNSPAQLEEHMLTSLSPTDLPHLEPRALEHFITVLGFTHTINVLNKIDPTACHDPAHIIGDLAFKKTGSIPGSFSLSSEKCMSGCIHGSLLAAVNDHVDYTQGQHEHVNLQDFTADIPSICKTGTADPTLEGTCIHGVGHAVMSLSTNLDEGLALCTAYEDERKRYYCETGVFMDTLLGGYNRYASSTNPLHPCDEYGDYPAACMRYQTDISTRNFEPDIVTYCKKLDEPGLESACFHGLGRSIARQVYDGDKNVRTCLESELTSAQVSCVESIAEILHEYDHDVGNKICDELASQPKLENTCRTALNQGLYSLEKDFSAYIGETVTRP